jgi:hypothetical protein
LSLKLQIDKVPEEVAALYDTRDEVLCLLKAPGARVKQSKAMAFQVVNKEVHI